MFKYEYCIAGNIHIIKSYANKTTELVWLIFTSVFTWKGLNIKIKYICQIWLHSTSKRPTSVEQKLVYHQTTQPQQLIIIIFVDCTYNRKYKIQKKYQEVYFPQIIQYR